MEAPTTNDILVLVRKTYCHSSFLTSISGPVEGVNVWIPVKNEPHQVAYELSKYGWLVRPGSQFDIDGKALGVRVTTTKLSEELASQLAKDIVSACC